MNGRQHADQRRAATIRSEVAALRILTEHGTLTSDGAQAVLEDLTIPDLQGAAC